MTRARGLGPRLICVQVLREVVERRRYLDVVLQEHLAGAPGDTALVQELAYGSLRWYHQLNAIVAQLLGKPIKAKDLDLRLLLLLGLYQLRYMRIAPHAAVDESVSTVEALGKPWAKGLVNACLRNYLRNPARADGILARDPVARFSHPAWMIDAVRHDHPVNWESALLANNERPPMVLRVNLRKQGRAAYLERLQANGIAANALELADAAVLLQTPVPVSALPGFFEGDVSVQDAAAQLAAALLDAQPGDRVLDACAAPGGKTAHLLERTPTISMLALDKDAARAALMEQTLRRLGLAGATCVADAAAPARWWDGRPFDRILADVPCSATGVIRRHPDIKLRRRSEDLPKLAAAQRQLLDGLWPTLRPGGKLLYVTCSVLADENENQMTSFLAGHADAMEIPLTAPLAQARRHGIQLLPGKDNTDGFFYACLAKR